MRVSSLCFTLALLAVAIFLPPHLERRPLEVRRIDEAGNETRCTPNYARVVEPARDQLTWRAFVDDFAYAAADAGPEGTAWLLCCVAGVVALIGLWAGGFRTALRRVLVTFALGVPITVALLYHSCFLEGRSIRLGPEARDEIPASLHAQTHHTTGLLSPLNVVRWHHRHGFRILNVSDKDAVDAGFEAHAALAKEYPRGASEPRMLVLVGEEWHGSPDLVLVNVRKAWRPVSGNLEETIRGVQNDGGAVFVAHPWAKLPPGMSLEQLFDAGIDGMEVVNGVIHGGRQRVEAARKRGKALVGVIDYKYGPHVTALTLFPAHDVVSSRNPDLISATGVVKVLREGRTKVLYAVPGGAMTGAVYKAGELGLGGAKAGVRDLLVVPRARRAVWFAWLAGVTLLWSVATRRRDADRPGGRRWAQLAFVVCVLLELAVPATLSWEVRESVGIIPLPYVIAAAAGVAIPLLACAHVIARSRELEAED